jgi:LPS-assembly protein
VRLRLIPFLLCCAYGGAAAQKLPPLEVDPGLLGPAVPRQPAAPAAQPLRPPAAAPAPAAAPPEAQSVPALPAAGAAPGAAPRQAAPASPGLAAPAREPVPAVRAPGPTPIEAEPESSAGAVGPPLRLSPKLSPEVKDGKEARPTFVSADKLTSEGERLIAEGDVEMRRIGSSLEADRVTYWQDLDEAEAEGSVRLATESDVITGPKARLRLSDSVGWFEQPAYTIRRGGARPGSVAISGSGTADRIDLEGEDRYRLASATFSTCGPEQYDWYAQTSELQLDFTREVAEARNARLVFQGVPILYTPWAEFSLNNRRKSGFLPPTFGTSSLTGTEYTQPWYWNIAPNMDATISPRIMTKRGVQLGTEFRYLDYGYSGTVRGEYLPNDAVFGSSRSLFSLQHAHDFGWGFTGALNLNRVSDDTYFSDLATRVAVTSQTNLVRQATLNYGAGGWWSVAANVLRYQTLQDPALPPVAKPYELLPQVTLQALQPDVMGFAFAATGQYTDFHHPTLDTARRVIAYPQVSWPFERPGYYLTPKVGMHWTHYAIDRRQSSGPESVSRSVPILSLDGGMYFERDAAWFGSNVKHTLEPRVYYLFVPDRDQNAIPLFDTGLSDFNFAQIFSENIFSGGDRIGDANQVTAAITSRLVDVDTGAEILRGAIGQRYYFRDQTVGLPGVVLRTERSADFLAAASGQLLPRLFFDTAWQYNPRDGETERLVAGARWQPGPLRVANVGYRFQRDVLKDIDLSAQWPLWGRWQGVARYNYSLLDKRLIETIVGAEYNAGCWALRGVVQRFATATQETNTAFFVQLELNGFSSIGSNPIDVLKRSIPGYGRNSQPTADPVFAAE